MNHLIVLAHPYDKSFNYALAEAIESTSIEAGAETRIRNLYEIGFDPVLKGEDLRNLQKKTYAADIQAEQAEIAWADLITFVYPVWWAGLPAILKGYVDRVFANGFAFADGETGPIGLLTGKKALLVSTSGFPDSVYEEIGMHASMKQTSDEAIFNFCGVEVAAHLFFGAIPYSTEEERVAYLDATRKVVKDLCQ